MVRKCPYAMIIHAITFDLDDTLWDNEPVIRNAEAQLYHWLQHHCPSVVEHYDVADLRALRERVVAEHPELGHDMSALRLESLRALMRETGHPPELGDAAFEVFFEARQRVTPYADVLPALERLAERFVLATLSNGNADVHRAGLGHCFAHHLSASELGCAKPDPAIFEASCRRLGLPPAQVLHVGDCPVNDVAGARSAGMRTAWINRRGEAWSDEPLPDIEAPDLLTIAEVLPYSARP